MPKPPNNRINMLVSADEKQIIIGHRKSPEELKHGIKRVFGVEPIHPRQPKPSLTLIK